MHSIAILGGTFDPIHNGHLQTSINIQNYFHFNSYTLLPCKVPTLKPAARATNQQRIDMIQLAIKDIPSFKLDLREIERATPSYMVETLQSFRLEYPMSSITLIMGYDSFISLPQWYQWEDIIALANILVINRNEFAQQEVTQTMHDFLKKHQSTNKTDILESQAGTVFLFDAGHYEVSSTKIREQLGKNEDPSHQLPKAVYEYIKAAELYQ